MQVRITYRLETYIEGENIEEIRSKFEKSSMGDGDFIEIVSVEDAETFKDISEKFN